MRKGSVFGSSLIIAGTTIGGGMLALPIAAAEIGYMASCVLMLITWVVMFYTSLLMIEVHQYSPREATLNYLAKQHLGRAGQVVAAITMMFLFYALCAAYITGGGESLTNRLSSLFGTEVSSYYGTLLITLLAFILVLMGTRTIDIANRLMFITKIVLLIVVLVVLFPVIKVDNLLDAPVKNIMLFSALPIIFTSFGFHGSIASIVRYMGVNIVSLRKIMFFGSIIPLVVYVLWLTVAMGLLTQTDLIASNSLSSFLAELSLKVQSPTVISLLTLFAEFALATSFLGVSLGLMEFLSDGLGFHLHKFSGRLAGILVTLLPPLFFGLCYPGGFITALGYAAVALAILAVLFPVVLVVSTRGNYSNTNYTVMGGKFMLVFVTVFAILVILSHFMQLLNQIPTI